MPVEINMLKGLEQLINCTTPIHKVQCYRACRIESTLRTLATWLILSQVYPYYRATLITPLLKLCKTYVLSTLLTNLHDQSIHVTGPIYKQFSDTMHTCTTMHKHCGLHQLCVVPSQVYCSLELHFVGGSSKRIGYSDWCRWWLSALELELRQPGI